VKPTILKNIIICLTLILIIFSESTTHAQIAYDTTVVLNEERMTEWILKNHPIVRQANLLNQMAVPERRAASGAFDPKLYGDWNAKSFDNKNYFQQGEAGLKMDAWFGAEIKAAYNYTSGVYLNPENNLPADGQPVLGLKVPLLQGLFIDQRRADLFKARNLANLNAAKRDEVVNNLILDATVAFWDWYNAKKGMEVITEAINVSRLRFEAVKDGFEAGDKPAIDTVEALIQLQNWQNELFEANIKLNKTLLEISNFIWNEDGKPVTLSPASSPLDESPGFESALNPDVLNNISQTHPSLRKYIFKQKELEVDLRLKRELFKPQLDVEYNLLGSGFSFQNDVSDLPFYNNYKWGATFSFPLFLRKASGSYQLAQLKLLENDLGRQQKELEIQNKINQISTEIDNLEQSFANMQELVENYTRLFEGEQEKFFIGESSLFLINSRETKLLEARLKLFKTEAELNKTKSKLRWAVGQLGI
jgi:outer membrane protein TolC